MCFKSFKSYVVGTIISKFLFNLGHIKDTLFCDDKYKKYIVIVYNLTEYKRQQKIVAGGCVGMCMSQDTYIINCRPRSLHISYPHVS